MIDFNYTQTDKTETLIEYVNEDGQVVKRYPISELEKYVTDNHLNLSYGTYGIDALHFNKFTQNHIAETEQEIEVYTPINEYIDENFEQLTKDFYLSLNPTEHKANNTPQKTLRQVG